MRVKILFVIFAAILGFAVAQLNLLGSGDCKNPNRKSALLAAKDQVCCDGLIKNLGETALGMAGFIPGQNQFISIFGQIAKIVQSFIQKHFGLPFEVIIARGQFAMKTNYKGSKICKFESNGIHLAVYQTPGNYDINNASSESFFDTFSSKDPLGINGMVKDIIGTISHDDHGSGHHGSGHHGSGHHGSGHHGSDHHGSDHHGSGHHGHKSAEVQQNIPDLSALFG